MTDYNLQAMASDQNSVNNTAYNLTGEFGVFTV